MSFFSSPTPREYFVLSWRWIVILVLLIATMSGAVRNWFLIPTVMACLILLTPLFNVISKNKIFWNSSIVFIVAAFVFNQIFLVGNSSEIASLMIELLIGLLPVSLSFRESERSYWMTLLNIVLITVGSVIVSESIQIYGLMLMFLLALIFNLNAAHIYFLTHSSLEERIKLPSGFFIRLFRVFPVGVLVGTLIFFVFPRVKNFNSWFNLDSQISKTGYTGKVSLTGGREIDESDALVFGVQAKDESVFINLSSDLLFRGNSLSQFDGKDWIELSSSKKLYSPNSHVKISKADTTKVHQLSIYREPSHLTTLFYPGVLISISEGKKSIGGVYVNELGDFKRGESQRDRYTYDVTIADAFVLDSNRMSTVDKNKNMSETFSNDGDAFQMTTEKYIRYTQIPKELKDAEYFNIFVKSVVANNDKKNVSEIASLLKKYFYDEFQASMLNSFSSANSFEAFLSVDKRGHCEYFATAAAMFFRSMGIPSRLALGYRGGYFNQVSGLFEVREKNAHVWVEVFMSEYGWVTFDPTPNNLEGDWNKKPTHFRLFANAAAFWFNRYVVDYDRDTQVGLFRSVKEFEFSDPSDEKVSFTLEKYWIFPIILVGILVFLILILRKNHLDRHPHRRLPKACQKFLEKMSSAGYQLESGESLSSFHQRLKQSGVDDKIIGISNRLFEQYLYSPIPPDKATLQEFFQEVKALKVEKK